jgi:hypothetical protein
MPVVSSNVAADIVQIPPDWPETVQSPIRSAVLRIAHSNAFVRRQLPVEGGIPEKFEKCCTALRAELRCLRAIPISELRLDTIMVGAEDPAR